MCTLRPICAPGCARAVVGGQGEVLCHCGCVMASAPCSPSRSCFTSKVYSASPATCFISPCFSMGSDTGPSVGSGAVNVAVSDDTGRMYRVPADWFLGLTALAGRARTKICHQGYNNKT